MQPASRATSLLQPVVVCHQLRSPENLGAVCRVMANFGCERLVLSEPMTHDFRRAESTAVHAEGVLANVAVAQSLPEALGSVVYAVGSSSRTLLKRRTPLTPAQAAVRLAEHAARGQVAWVLGGEKRGLSDEDLSLCHDVVVIDTDARQPSMNISHALAVLLHASSAHDRPDAVPEVEGASAALVGRLEDVFRAAMEDAGFFERNAPSHIQKELMRSLVRHGITRREAELWLSVFTHVRRVSAPAAGR